MFFALKRNQNSLYEDVQEYFRMKSFQKESVRAVIQKDTGKGTHGQVEISRSIIK